MNGFRTELLDKILGLNGHLLIQPLDSPLTDWEMVAERVAMVQGVRLAAPVVEGQALDMPRAENSEYLMALGIGGSLMDALQAATTNLAQWLERDYKLNGSEVAMVLGTSIRYDIAEIVDGQLNMAAKVPKSVLSQLRQ